MPINESEIIAVKVHGDGSWNWKQN